MVYDCGSTTTMVYDLTVWHISAKPTPRLRHSCRVTKTLQHKKMLPRNICFKSPSWHQDQIRQASWRATAPGPLKQPLCACNEARGTSFKPELQMISDPLFNQIGAQKRAHFLGTVLAALCLILNRNPKVAPFSCPKNGRVFGSPLRINTKPTSPGLRRQWGRISSSRTTSPQHCRCNRNALSSCRHTPSSLQLHLAAPDQLPPNAKPNNTATPCAVPGPPLSLSPPSSNLLGCSGRLWTASSVLLFAKCNQTKSARARLRPASMVPAICSGRARIQNSWVLKGLMKNLELA